MNGPMFAKVYYVDDINHKVKKEEILFMADSYTEAMKLVEKYYGINLVAASIYGFEPNDIIRIADIDAMLEEARKTFEV